MKKFVALLLTLTLLVASTSISISADETLNDIFSRHGYTVQEDPNQLINLAILYGIDLSTITYENKTILDVLTPEQTQKYAYSETTVGAYADDLKKALDGLANGWTAELVMEYADSAFLLYNKNINDLQSGAEQPSKESVSTSIKNYIKASANDEIIVGDTAETLINLMNSYQLMGFEVTETPRRENFDTAYGVENMPAHHYSSTMTTWNTYGDNFKALFNGKVTDITENSITVETIGTTNNLTVIYSVKKNLKLVSDEIQVGTKVKQGDELVKPKDSYISVAIRIDTTPVDLLLMLGSTGKLLLNEYQREILTDYTLEKAEYIQDIMNYTP